MISFREQEEKKQIVDEIETSFRVKYRSFVRLNSAVKHYCILMTGLYKTIRICSLPVSYILFFFYTTPLFRVRLISVVNVCAHTHIHTLFDSSAFNFVA